MQFWTQTGTTPTITVTDSEGNTYTRIGTQLVNTQGDFFIDRFISVNGVGGAGHTLTSHDTGGTNTFTVVAMVELTGCNLTSPVDQSNTDVSNSDGHADPFSSGTITITPPASGEVLISVGTVNDSAADLTFTEANGFTIQKQFGNIDKANIQLALGTMVVSASGTYSASWSSGGGTLNWGSTIDSFKGAAVATNSNQSFPMMGVGAIAPLAWVIRRRRIRARERNAELRRWKR